MLERPSFAERMQAREAERQREQRRQEIEAHWAKHFDHLRGFTELAVWFAVLYALWPLWLLEAYRDPWWAWYQITERLADMRDNP